MVVLDFYKAPFPFEHCCLTLTDPHSLGKLHLCGKSTFVKVRNIVISWTYVSRENTFPVSRFTAFFFPLYRYIFILPILTVLYGDTVNQGIFPFIPWLFKGKMKHGKRIVWKSSYMVTQGSEPILHRFVTCQGKWNPCYFVSIFLVQPLEIEEIDSFPPPTSLQVKKSDSYKYIQPRHLIYIFKNSVGCYELSLLLNIQVPNSLPLVPWWLPTTVPGHRGTCAANVCWINLEHWESKEVQIWKGKDQITSSHFYFTNLKKKKKIIGKGTWNIWTV